MWNLVLNIFRRAQPSKPAQPPCSEWNIWEGREIEGHHCRGETTLFVRRLPGDWTYDFALRAFSDRIQRVWFCAEFTDWEVVRRALNDFREVCLEVRYGDPLPPEDVARKCRKYLKLPGVPRDFMREGDEVCFGPAFNDAAFELGQPFTVTNQRYLKDQRIV